MENENLVRHTLCVYVRERVRERVEKSTSAPFICLFTYTRVLKGPEGSR